MPGPPLEKARRRARAGSALSSKKFVLLAAKHLEPTSRRRAAILGRDADPRAREDLPLARAYDSSPEHLPSRRRDGHAPARRRGTG